MQIFRRKSIDNNTFSRNSSQFLAIPQKFLANSLHVQIFISTFAIATINMRSTPHGVEMPRQNTAVRLPRVF